MYTPIFDIPFLTFIAQLALAMILGLLLGPERIYAHKTAGMRTYALVSVASALFVYVSVFIGKNFANADFNPAFIAGSIITGIGFLGTGLIIFNAREGHVENLTTASGLWICAGIGMAVGYGLYREAIFVAVLAFFVLGILSFVERKIRLRFFPDSAFEKEQKKVRTRRKAAVMDGK